MNTGYLKKSYEFYIFDDLDKGDCFLFTTPTGTYKVMKTSENNESNAVYLKDGKLTFIDVFEKVEVVL